MKYFLVEVEGVKFEIRSTDMGQAAKKAINDFLAHDAQKDRKAVTLSVTVYDAPAVRRL